jgi:hypothetical protein
MAYEGKLETIPGLTAAGDLSADQFKFVTIGASGVARNVTNGGYVDGVLQDKPAAAGRAATVANGGVSKTVAGAAVAKGAKVMSDATGRAVTAADVATSASKACSAETYNMNPGDTIVVDVDDVGNATCTWDAAQASITDTTTYAVADQDTKTLTFTITGGEYDGIAQLVTFDITVTTALLVAQQLNDKLQGCFASVVGGQVKVTTDGAGSGFAIAVTAGTSDLTWAAPVAGTGDAADINAVTAAEVKTVIEADSTATVAVATGVPTISSPTTGVTSELDFKSGNALTPLGLSVEVVTGSASDSHIRGRALEAASAAGDLIAVSLAPTSKV